MHRLLLAALLLALTALTACTDREPRPDRATAVPAPSPSPAAVSVTPPPAPPRPTVSKDGLRHFLQVALGTEYGDRLTVISKWSRPVVTVGVHGSVGKPSRTCLSRVIADFNALTATTDLRLTTADADIEMHFAPVTEFRSLDPHYVPGNNGFVYVFWDASHAMTSGTVLIRTSGISDRIRCHLIREELTKGMGFLRDTFAHDDSVFYGRYLPAPTRYSTLDSAAIRLMYSGAVAPGDTRADVTAAVTVR